MKKYEWEDILIYVNNFMHTNLINSISKLTPKNMLQISYIFTYFKLIFEKSQIGNVQFKETHFRCSVPQNYATVFVLSVLLWTYCYSLNCY